ncbi:MAG TPA: S41 family peptidase [Desulfobacteraceae bacterium]|nr:S41 family peptidase [Desulfobacteraceae bacterium]HPJ69017.1 S41 family peptidase [Desulfobacteraceae bacterium]HPQ29445.1 S41 family peptidase [Desulfobacteraceae bacterium]
MSVSKTKFSISIILISLIVCGALFLKGNNYEVNADTKDVYKNIELFTEVLRQIENNYVETQEPKDLIYGAIKGMIRDLDPHSSFMTKEEYSEFMLETKGSFTGIGIEITIKDNILTVVSPIEDTPAYKAGIKAGDKIFKVENEPTKDMTMLEAVKKIRGPKGTKVNLTILREGSDKPLEFSITRDVIPLKSVRHNLLSPDIAYIRISNFQSKTAEDLSSVIKELKNERKIKGLILDLRNNPGGLLSQAIEVSDIFLDSGIIVSTKGRNNAHNITASAHENSTKIDYTIIVLVNGGSASAAEIVSGALQDNKKALILGTRTFGKGSVQTILPLSDGSGLRLTTARYYTPSGKSIQSSGITPDIEIAFMPQEEKKEKKETHFFREEDLEGNVLDNDSDTRESEKSRQDSDRDEFAKNLLEKDNQIRQAFQLLQSWTIFSQIKGTP